MENLNETSIDEVDTDGGWLITHHTKTWDTRVRLDSIGDVLEQKKQVLVAAQADYDATEAQVTSVQAQVAEKIAQPIKIDQVSAKATPM